MHRVRLSKRAHRFVQSCFTILLFMGCFSVSTPVAALEVPALGGYASGDAGGYYSTEAPVMQAAQRVAVGCANYSGGLTICYDPYEIVDVPSWSSDPGTAWQWWRWVQTRTPVRRLMDGVLFATDYEYYTFRIVLLYFCRTPFYMQDDPATWQIGSPRPTCTDGVLTPPPPPPPPPPDCPVSDFAPYTPDPYPLNTGNLVTLAKTAVSCLQNCGGIPSESALLASGYRPQAYQDHLAEIWEKWNRLKNDYRQECLDLRARLEREFFFTHEIEKNIDPIPPGPNCHSSGTCFDVNSGQIPSVDSCSLTCRVRRPIARDPGHTVPY